MARLTPGLPVPARPAAAPCRLTSLEDSDSGSSPFPVSAHKGAQDPGWRLVAALAVMAVAVGIWHVVAIPITDPHYSIFGNYADLQIYRAGAQAVLTGTGLYDGPVLWDMQWTYTPFAAATLTPLAAMSQYTANIVWWSATFVALVIVVGRSLSSLGYRLTIGTTLSSLLLAFIVTSFEPARDTFWFGQINIFLMALILCDLLSPSETRLRGFAVGVAAGIKLTPLLFLIYLVLTRQWKACLNLLLGFASTVVLGYVVAPKDSWTYWSGRFLDAANVGGVDSPANQSINGFIAQMLRSYDITRYLNTVTGTFEPPTWLWLSAALPALVLGLWAAAVAHRNRQELLAITMTAMTATAVSPFSWGHHWVWFVPLFIIALHYAHSSTSTLRWAAPAVMIVPVFTWWWNYWDSGPWRDTDHIIGIGLFMLPRPDDPHWWQQLTIPLYAGCYVLVFTVVVLSILAANICSASERTGPTADLRTPPPTGQTTCLTRASASE